MKRKNARVKIKVNVYNIYEGDDKNPSTLNGT